MLPKHLERLKKSLEDKSMMEITNDEKYLLDELKELSKIFKNYSLASPPDVCDKCGRPLKG